MNNGGVYKEPLFVEVSCNVKIYQQFDIVNMGEFS